VNTKTAVRPATPTVLESRPGWHHHHPIAGTGERLDHTDDSHEGGNRPHQHRHVSSVMSDDGMIVETRVMLWGDAHRSHAHSNPQ
jgi:hypothetical protein